MSISDKMWDGITRVIKMDSKVESLASMVVDQQKKIEDLTGRIIRLETALEMAMIVNKRQPGQLQNDQD